MRDGGIGPGPYPEMHVPAAGTPAGVVAKNALVTDVVLLQYSPVWWTNQCTPARPSVRPAENA